uniref:Large ribosomal subunit protein eL20 n=1 Tax=Staphylothermus marinus TaxID=2280 RepID=A0A7C4HD70_STAMA
MYEVKVYRIEGFMLINHDKVPVWQKFVKEVRALNEKDALEYVYSVLGSNHKVKRRHIRITSISEIPVEKARNRNIVELSRIKGFVK